MSGIPLWHLITISLFLNHFFCNQLYISGTRFYSSVTLLMCYIHYFSPVQSAKILFRFSILFFRVVSFTKTTNIKIHQRFLSQLHMFHLNSSLIGLLSHLCPSQGVSAGFESWHSTRGRLFWEQHSSDEDKLKGPLYKRAFLIRSHRNILD